MSSGGGGRFTRMTQLLEGKNAIIYGAGGGLGSGVARTFAREGANLYLAGAVTGTIVNATCGMVAG